MSDKVQRYLCKECDRTFVASTGTITSYTKKGREVWEEYFRCMMEGISVRKAASICEINKNTAFVWRHKILDTLQVIENNVKLEGTGEPKIVF